MVAVAEDIVFCDSVQLTSKGAENFTLPKFDSKLGTLEAVEISLDLNLSQQLQAENTGGGNSTINSTIKSVLTLLLPDAKEIKANASLALARDLPPFDGDMDFSGTSGIDLTESSSGSSETYSSSQGLLGFVAGMPGEKLLLQSVLESKPNMNITGSASSHVQTKTGAIVCIYYRYDAGKLIGDIK